MRIPIGLALTYPKREENPAPPLDLLTCPPLTFAAPDEETFRCFGLARQAAAQGGTACAVLNGANEAAVGLFLQDQLGFLEIADAVETALNAVPQSADTGLEAALDADRMARDIVFSRFG